MRVVAGYRVLCPKCRASLHVQSGSIHVLIRTLAMISLLSLAATAIFLFFFAMLGFWRLLFFAGVMLGIPLLLALFLSYWGALILPIAGEPPRARVR